MLQKLADFTLPLAVMLLTLSLPGNVVAGPPEKMSSKMTFDTVADGLRKYREEKDEEKRSEWLERLAPTGDTRVAVALGEALGIDDPVYGVACHLLSRHFVRGTQFDRGDEIRVGAWWRAHAATLRRRADQHPR